ncbi:MAG TPA: LacI family DNA-binding transcriptional regulator [Solirubrobacteraceae bacterium]|jgi:LacI family transcriptional regulator|nr:LacI family DNA-binding transcriptional regulator [Solirubrobacteraceae bacterium]
MTARRAPAGAVSVPGPRKPPTIFDVAAEAGVSKSTVSNVVRGVEEVSTGTRERVLRAIERLDYKPNVIARQFVQQRTMMLGVLLGDLSNPYYAQMAQVVERAAFGFGYTTMFCNIEGADEIAVVGVDALLSHRVAGIVFLAYVPRPSDAYDALQRAGVPIVFLGLSESWGDSVGPRDTAGGKLATEHLIDLGHRRIAYVRTPLVERSGDRARYSGYRSAMRRRGLEPLPAFLWEPGADTLCIGRHSLTVQDAITGAGAPTGLFASNDIGAVGLIEACERAGRAVPEAVSVVGFDDITIAGLHRISLTTVAQPLHFQAERAVGLLLERIKNPGIGPRHVRVPVELRVRESTARAPQPSR